MSDAYAGPGTYNNAGRYNQARTGDAAYRNAQSTRENQPQPNMPAAESAAGQNASGGRGRQAAAAGGPGAGAPRRSAAASESDYLGTGKPCVRCGRPVDPGQARCPHCGAYQKPVYTNPIFIGTVVVCVVLIVILSIALNSCTSQGTTQSSSSSTETATQSDTTATSEARDLLQSGINSAQNYIDTNDSSTTHLYTAYSIHALRDAISNAQTVLANEDATQTEVSDASSKIQNAIESLVTLQSFDTLEWPMYADLAQNIGSYVGSQIAMNGVIYGSSTSGTDGTLVYVAISGDTSALVGVQLSGDEESNVTDLTYDGYINFGGVVTGTTTYTNAETGETSTIPLIYCDYFYAA